MKRGAAYVIDFFFGTALFDVYFQIFKHKKAAGEEVVHGPVAILAFIVSYYGYYIVMEYFRGQTIGKKVMRLKVIKSDGSRLTLTDVIKRHLFDLVESVCCVFLAFIVMISNNKGKRIGDFIANTEVVDARNVPAVLPT
ncbi:RDD family protein [Puia dinghuensis]|nr:RDD family protein [Puia dinghuensis]